LYKKSDCKSFSIPFFAVHLKCCLKGERRSCASWLDFHTLAKKCCEHFSHILKNIYMKRKVTKIFYTTWIGFFRTYYWELIDLTFIQILKIVLTFLFKYMEYYKTKFKDIFWSKFNTLNKFMDLILKHLIFKLSGGIIDLL